MEECVSTAPLVPARNLHMAQNRDWEAPQGMHQKKDCYQDIFESLKYGVDIDQPPRICSQNDTPLGQNLSTTLLRPALPLIREKHFRSQVKRYNLTRRTQGDTVRSPNIISCDLISDRFNWRDPGWGPKSIHHQILEDQLRYAVTA